MPAKPSRSGVVSVSRPLAGSYWVPTSRRKFPKGRPASKTVMRKRCAPRAARLFSRSSWAPARALNEAGTPLRRCQRSASPGAAEPAKHDVLRPKFYGYLRGDHHDEDDRQEDQRRDLARHPRPSHYAGSRWTSPTRDRSGTHRARTIRDRPTRSRGGCASGRRLLGGYWARPGHLPTRRAPEVAPRT
jgi:hypothetical protein